MLQPRRNTLCQRCPRMARKRRGMRSSLLISVSGRREDTNLQEAVEAFLSKDKDETELVFPRPLPSTILLLHLSTGEGADLQPRHRYTLCRATWLSG